MSAHVRHVHHETKQVTHGPSQEKNFKDQIEEEKIARRGGIHYTMDDEQWWVQKARTTIHTYDMEVSVFQMGWCCEELKVVAERHQQQRREEISQPWATFQPCQGIHVKTTSETTAISLSLSLSLSLSPYSCFVWSNVQHITIRERLSSCWEHQQHF